MTGSACRGSTRARVFAALLGTPQHGRWLIEPQAEARPAGRRYQDATLVLETDFATDEGSVRVIDFMPPRGSDPDIVRIVEGLSGRVEMRMELVVRYDYGSIVPWVRRIDDATTYVAGPDALCLRTPVETRGEDLSTVGDFVVSEGEQVPFVLTWYPSHRPLPREIEAGRALGDTRSWWREWADGHEYEGLWRDEVLRSLIILKALTYEPTGGIVAAPTTSLPEYLGGVRNWDYRFCWLRDAAFTLDALLEAGFTGEAKAWRDWLLRAIAGDPADIQIMYGVAGERRLTEFEVPWLPGYMGSKPVRIGNAASDQWQLDVFGEVMDALYHAEELGLEPESRAWAIQKKLLEHLELEWREPDNGIWEVRGPRRHFTHSKVMAWVAADRAARAVHSHADGSVDRWRRLRDEIHDEVMLQGFDSELNSFVQFYGATKLDASLLLIPLVGFLPASDGRVRGTVEAIERDLCEAGFVMRYQPRRRHGERGWSAAGGRRFLAVHVLAGRQPESDRASRRCRGALRAVARPPKRPRPDLGGIRHTERAPRRELPPGVHPRRAREHRPEPLPAARPPSGAMGALPEARDPSAAAGADSLVLPIGRGVEDPVATKGAEMGHVKDVMTQNPTSCDPSTNVVEAAKVMASEDVGSVPVVKDGRLVGIVTDRDIVVRVVTEGRDPSSTTVGEIASSDLETVSPDDDLDTALRKMASSKVRRLPVVEGDQLVGIVAQADVARQGDDSETGHVVEEISTLVRVRAACARGGSGRPSSF